MTGAYTDWGPAHYAQKDLEAAIRDLTYYLELVPTTRKLSDLLRQCQFGLRAKC